MGLFDKYKDRIAAIASKPSWKVRPEVLLCVNTVKPMHGVVPRLILGKEWWDRTRRAAYASTDFHCIACGVHKTQAVEHQWLEGHEIYNVNYRKGIQTYIETVPLCHYCHNFIHDGRLMALRDKGDVTEEKYDAVRLHGATVIATAGLTKTIYKGRMAEWDKWKLILEGREYPPIYKNYDEWLRHFNGVNDE